MTDMAVPPVHLGPILYLCPVQFLIYLSVTASSLKVTSWFSIAIDTYSHHQHKGVKVDGKNVQPS